MLLLFLRFISALLSVFNVSNSFQNMMIIQAALWPGHNKCTVGGPMAHPNKSKMTTAAIFSFGKISITPDWKMLHGHA